MVYSFILVLRNFLKMDIPWGNGLCSHFIQPENTKKPKVFWCFQGVKNREIGQKWVKRKMNQVGKKIQNMLPAIESDIRESWIVS